MWSFSCWEYRNKWNSPVDILAVDMGKRGRVCFAHLRTAYKRKYLFIWEKLLCLQPFSCALENWHFIIQSVNHSDTKNLDPIYRNHHRFDLCCVFCCNLLEKTWLFCLYDSNPNFQHEYNMKRPHDQDTRRTGIVSESQAWPPSRPHRSTFGMLIFAQELLELKQLYEKAVGEPYGPPQSQAKGESKKKEKGKDEGKKVDTKKAAKEAKRVSEQMMT